MAALCYVRLRDNSRCAAKEWLPHRFHTSSRRTTAPRRTRPRARCGRYQSWDCNSNSMSATRHQSLEFYAVFDVRPDCEGRYYISSWKSHFRFYMLLNRDPYRNPPLEEVFAGSHNTLLFRERKREDSRMAKLEKFLLLKTNHRSRSHWDHRRHDEGYRRGGGGEGL